VALICVNLFFLVVLLLFLVTVIFRRMLAVGIAHVRGVINGGVDFIRMHFKVGLSDMKVINFLTGSSNTEFRCVGWSLGKDGIVNGLWFLLVVVDGIVDAISVSDGYDSMDNRVILESISMDRNAGTGSTIHVV
jgi:hypothetical protein